MDPLGRRTAALAPPPPGGGWRALLSLLRSRSLPAQCCCLARRESAWRPWGRGPRHRGSAHLPSRAKSAPPLLRRPAPAGWWLSHRPGGGGASAPPHCGHAQALTLGLGDPWCGFCCVSDLLIFGSPCDSRSRGQGWAESAPSVETLRGPAAFRLLVAGFRDRTGRDGGKMTGRVPGAPLTSPAGASLRSRQHDLARGPQMPLSRAPHAFCTHSAI